MFEKTNAYIDPENHTFGYCASSQCSKQCNGGKGSGGVTGSVGADNTPEK